MSEKDQNTTSTMTEDQWRGTWAYKAGIDLKYLTKIVEIERRLKDDRMYDQENAHLDADEVLCELLSELGYTAVVEGFRKLPKWYA